MTLLTYCIDFFIANNSFSGWVYVIPVIFDLTVIDRLSND